MNDQTPEQPSQDNSKSLLEKSQSSTHAQKNDHHLLIRKWSIIFLATIVSIISLVTIWLYLTVPIFKTTQSKPVTVKPSNAPSSAPDPTANWEIHRNDEFGFEVKYPKDNFVSAEEQTENSLEILFIGGYSLRVTVTPTETKSVRELSWLNSQQTNLGPYEALESIPDTPPFNSRTYTLIYEGKLYQLYGQNYGEGEKARLDRILSTFRFAESDQIETDKTACGAAGGTYLGECPENPSPNAGICITCSCPEGRIWSLADHDCVANIP